MSKLLFDEHPLVILPELAVRIGLNEAIVLQQVHYWLQKSDHVIEDRKWVYNTVEEWAKQFPFFSPSTVRRTLEKLAESGYLITGNFNKAKIDKTKWYAIDYKKLESEQNSPFVKSANPSAQIEQMHLSKLSSPSAQNEQMHLSKLDNSSIQRLPEISTETTTTTPDLGCGCPEMKLKNAGDLPWFIAAHWGAQGKIPQIVLKKELMPLLNEVGCEEMEECIRIVARAPKDKQGVNYLLGTIRNRTAERAKKAIEEATGAKNGEMGMADFKCTNCGAEAAIPVAHLVKGRGRTFPCTECGTMHPVDNYLPA